MYNCSINIQLRIVSLHNVFCAYLKERMRNLENVAIPLLYLHENRQ
jgi:hypothetical protein